ncbi:hypothetical protein SteCoe_18553 [Stentor coeruleus]|uniref:Casein kinase I n=1 Tax=Stentor coeruleus TaxID=5963 RepID=A0A1R2BWM4_9CILI|nr:hypothetical protein SteCoe_18553 [Stentor coeruleus]
MELLLITKGYNIGKKIGEGGFGEVYNVMDSNNNQYALKIISNKEIASLEYNILSKLQKCKGVPTVYDFIISYESSAIIMTLLEKSVFQHFRIKKTINRLCKFAIDGLKILKRIHRKGYLHKDIKPNQFMYPNTSHVLHLVDYNLSSKYIKQKKHIALGSSSKVVGSSMFASLNSHRGLTLSRRDDLTSFAYTLIYLALGSLPWSPLQKYKTTKDKWKQAERLKSQISIETLCKGLSSEFSSLLEYSTNLHFEEKPDYKFLISSFKKLRSYHKTQQKRSIPYKINYILEISNSQNHEEILDCKFPLKKFSYESLDKTEEIEPPIIVRRFSDLK